MRSKRLIKKIHKNKICSICGELILLEAIPSFDYNIKNFGILCKDCLDNENEEYSRVTGVKNERN